MKKVFISILFTSLLTSCINYVSPNESGVDSLCDSTSVDSVFVESTRPAPKVDEKKVSELKGRFTKKSDEFSDNTWVKHVNEPKYRDQDAVYMYFGLDSDGVPSNPRFVVQYHSEDWLFIRSMVFNIDGVNHTFVPIDMERDNDTDIWEWCDVSLNLYEDAQEIVKAISKANKVKIKFNGSQYYDTRTLTKSQIRSIKETYEYYVALGGVFDDSEIY